MPECIFNNNKIIIDFQRRKNILRNYLNPNERKVINDLF